MERERERRKKGKREKREKARNREPEKKKKRGRREGGDTRSTGGFTSNESGGSSCYARYRLAES